MLNYVYLERFFQEHSNDACMTLIVAEVTSYNVEYLFQKKKIKLKYFSHKNCFRVEKNIFQTYIYCNINNSNFRCKNCI